ncbi:MAG: hypothetical protein H7249_20110 [Chitinophagaceae bacterium]|nr:hypothetical protein [Oligoflexus sp.]
MKKLFIAIALLNLTTITACAHYPDVRAKESGIHSVILNIENKDEGYQEANAQANSFCKDKYQKTAFQVSEKSEYVGSLDETTYIAAKTASKVITAVGAGAAIFGGQSESKAGVGGAVGGGVADSALGNGYRYTMEFKCE